MKHILILLIFFTVALSIRAVFYYENRPVYISEQEISLKHLVMTEPRVLGHNQLIRIDSIAVYAPQYPSIRYGDLVEITGRIEEQEYVSKQTGKPIKQLVVRNPEIEVLPQNTAFGFLSAIRSRIETTFKQILPSNEAGLLLGIVLGVRGGIDQDFYDQLKLTGVLHVVAASGANISMVSAFLLSIFITFMKRQTAIIFTIIGICFYAVLSGFDPPIIRAAIMAGVAYGAALLGRQNAGVLSLLMAAFVMLIVDPALVQDIGFQLSFLSTLGIIIIKPIIDKVPPFNRKMVVTEDLSTTLAAQIATVPLMVTVFGTYSPASIIVNLLILWTIPFLMILGGVAAIAALILPILAAPFLYLAYPLLLYFKAVVELLEPLASLIIVQKIPLLIIVGLYLMLGSFLIVLNKREKVYEV